MKMRITPLDIVEKEACERKAPHDVPPRAGNTPLRSQSPMDKGKRKG